MARPLRIEAPDAIYHVTSRGNNGQRICFDDTDRRLFFGALARTVARHRWTCFAFCLMTNHYHLLVAAPFGGLSRGMCELNTGYARSTNRRHGRRDHLFRNRFFAASVERDSHLLEAARYVVLNPVRARLCERPEDWRWSSFRACAGLEFAPDFLALNELLRLFGERPKQAQRRYREFVAAACAPPVPGTVTEV